MSDKNQIKPFRNPNSPEAIQARLDGLENPQAFQDRLIIDDSSANTIQIDKTRSFVDQKVNPSKGGKSLTRNLLRASLGLDAYGNQICTLYYFDSYRLKWVVIKDYVNKPLPSDPEYYSEKPWPRSTYGSTYGNFGASAPGENWRNENRSMKDIQNAQKRVYKNVIVDSTTKNDKEQPDDGQYEDDFSGSR